MNKEKYYTPTIEEFHVGFEYEFLVNSVFLRDLKSWEKCICYTPNTLFAIIKDIIENVVSVRVKYLDKEDIESFGVKLDYKSDTHDIYKLNDIWIFLFKNNIIRINQGDEMIFRDGMIRNKSELKVLLKQLNILT